MAAHEWWREHPAYNTLVNTFKGSTATPNHLAYLALTGLRAANYDIVQDTPLAFGVFVQTPDGPKNFKSFDDARRWAEDNDKKWIGFLAGNQLIILQRVRKTDRVMGADNRPIERENTEWILAHAVPEGASQ